MKNLWTIAEFTIKDMLSRKSFIISMIVILLIIVVGFNIPNIMEKIGGNSLSEQILVVDTQNLFDNNVEILNQMDLGYEFEFTAEDLSSEQIKEKIDNNDIDTCIKFTRNENIVNMEYIVESSSMTFGTVPQDLIIAFQNLYSNVQITKLDITPEELAILEPQFNVELTETDENAAKGNVVIMMLISLVLFYAIYFCAQQVSTAITTEKTSKIIETLVTSTDPKTIVLGKTLGIGIIGLLQVILIIAVAGISANFCMDKELLETIFDLSNITPTLVIITLVYFILGYMLYSLGFALTGATVSKPEDVQSANGPINFVAVIGFYLAYFTMTNPSSNLNKISGILPISSPFSMPLRVMMGTATTSELLLSIGVLIITIALVAIISIKVYSSAILNTGTKISIKQALKSEK